MLTVLIRYKGKDDAAKRFVEEMISSGIVSDIRNEEGSLRYEYFFSLEDDESVLLVDSWANQEALDRHHELPLMGKIKELREKYDLRMEVEKYESLHDEKDEKYIRR
ncbi:MAG: antibiotic biosynthesis monooxygenase [Erysipelotrichaceae bacterium]|jgi:quinol monooxygenase YgiN|nr:antibiotic biosynthesis monooxygenase [Erysipelotrichaceae bacterium]